MAQVKYQVFVSSTFEDLKTERDQAIRAILEMGHIPVGMEMFSAADAEQWQIITRHIDESDFYCVLLAHRYGSETEGISYTRKEYEYALSIGVPVLGFIIDADVSWPTNKTDKKTGIVSKLNDFKALVRQKPVSQWKSAEDLYGKVGIALGKQIALTPRPGWIRTPPGASADVTSELTRLSAENASLRDRLEKADAKAKADHASTVSSTWQQLGEVKLQMSYRYRTGDRSWHESQPFTLDYLFFLLSADLYTEVEVSDAANTLAMEIREDKERNWDIVALNQTRSFLADLALFGVIEPSQKRHPVSDTGDYWTLTTLGRELHRLIRMRMMDDGDAEDSAGAPKSSGSRKTAASKQTTGPST